MNIKMYKLELPSDLTKAANLEKRRNGEIQRQERIFNAKVRTIGVDKGALDFQVQERNLKEKKEAEILNAYAEELNHRDKVACLLDQRQKKDMRKLYKTIDEFRQVYQRPEARREFDLNDPEQLKKQDPAVGSGQGLQGLLGEDERNSEWRKSQQEQMRGWSQQQQAELEEAKAGQRSAEQHYDQIRVELDNRAVALQKIEQERKRAIAVASKDFNLSKAAETAEKRKLEKQQEEEDNRVEILNLLQGDLLSENPDQAISVLGPQRVRPDHWKGLRPEEIKDITDFQLQQAQEKLKAKAQEQECDREWDRYQMSSARAALLHERQQARLNRQLRRAQDNINAQLSEQHRAQKNILEKQVYTNAPDDRYFAQFNTTSR
ncbi:RIB43A-like with coiled-coils protein 2 [Amia ocellicauda]|uniref:RIB43A-like with coiled-coils protein 2 n=1 Tax=Amia ocellicauda TaxID=2972642 RepID=UPI003464132D